MEERKTKDFRPNALLQSMDTVLVGCGVCTQKKPWPFGYEPHPFIRIYYLEKGCFDLMFTETIFHLEAGGIYLIPANIPFSYLYREECRHLYIHFSSRSIDGIGIFNQPVRLTGEADRSTGVKIEHFIADAFRSKDSIRENMELRIQLFRILIPFLEQFASLCGHDTDPGRYDGLSKVVNHIEQNLNRPINVRDLHTLSAMRRADFSAHFRKRYGLPPKQYICMRRISNARNLLVRTEMTLQEIASACGYEDLFLFFRMFKKYTRMTPTEFRSRFRQY